MKKKHTKGHGSDEKGRCGWSTEGPKTHEKLKDDAKLQQFEQCKGEELHRKKFCKESGLNPMSTAMSHLSNTRNGGVDSESEIEFGGENLSEDHQTKEFTGVSHWQCFCVDSHQ